MIHCGFTPDIEMLVPGRFSKPILTTVESRHTLEFKL